MQHNTKTNFIIFNLKKSLYDSTVYLWLSSLHVCLTPSYPPLQVDVVLIHLYCPHHHTFLHLFIWFNNKRKQLVTQMADAVLKQIKSAKYLLCWSWECSFLHINLKSFKVSLSFLGRDRIKALVSYVRAISTLHLTQIIRACPLFWQNHSDWICWVGVIIQNRTLEDKREAQKSITWLLGGH